MTNFMLGVFEITVGMSLFIAVLLLCLKLFGGKFTAKCRYIIWALVMLRLAIPFSIGLLPTLIEIPIDTELVQSENLSSVPSKNTDPTTPSRPSDYGDVSVNPTVPGTTVFPTVSGTPNTDTLINPDNTQTLPGDQAELVIPSQPIAETPPEQPISLNRILDIAGVVYLVGAAVFFVWSLVSYIIYTSKILSSAKAADDHTQKIFSNICEKYGMKKQPTLLVTSGIHSPAAFGIFHRRIVLPDIAFTDNGLVGTLAHEVTHCKRGDLYVKLVELIACSFYWFNPLVHIAAFQCEMEMELSCDEKVLSGSSEEARAAYADVMLDIIRRCRRNKGALTTHFNPKKSAVTARFKNILYGSGKRRGWILIGVCLVLCILAGAIVACQTDDLSDEHWYAEGYYLKCDNGSDVIVMDAEGANPASPCKMTVIDDSVSFEGLTDGDRIKIEISMVMTTYPGQTEVHSIEKLSDGTIDDIDPAVLDSLCELGWICTDKENVKDQTDNKEINISEFIGLDWKLYEGLEYPCLSRDEILAFDKDAQYIGAVPGYSRPGPGFSFYIKSEGKTMFGYDGILYYRGDFEPTGAEENVVEYEHEFYSNCYKYTGDGSDIKFGSDLEFTVTDVTLNQLLDILDKAAKLADTDALEMKILYEDEYKKVSDIAEILSVNDNDAILENAGYELSTRPVTVMQTDTHIYDMKIHLLSENRFESKNLNRMELYPDRDTAQNRVFIRIYSREKTASEAVVSEKYISGKYIWSDPDSISGEGSTPCIYFADDGDCVLFVNYSEGGCDIEGRYYISDGKIYVNLDFSNTIFEDTGDEYTDTDFMADKYVFTIVNDSEIVINRGCYAVEANDKFIRT